MKHCAESLSVYKDVQLKQRQLLSNGFSFWNRNARNYLVTLLCFSFFVPLCRSIWKAKNVGLTRGIDCRIQPASECVNWDLILNTGRTTLTSSRCEKEANFLSFMKIQTYRMESSAYQSFGSRFKFYTTIWDYILQVRTRYCKWFIYFNDHFRSCHPWVFCGFCLSKSFEIRACIMSEGKAKGCIKKSSELNFQTVLNRLSEKFVDSFKIGAQMNLTSPFSDPAREVLNWRRPSGAHF